MLKGELHTAFPLSSAERMRLEARFADLCGEPVALIEQVDESLICGMRVLVGGKIYDINYKARLEDIRRALKGGEGDA